MYSLGQENSENTQRCFTSVEQENNSIIQVSHVTADLRLYSNDLHQLVDVFQIGKN